MSIESDHWELWRIDARREILVTNYPGPPGEVCSLTEEGLARQAAGQPPTISQIVFPAAALKTAESFSEAKALADQWATDLGYTVTVVDRFAYMYGDEDEAEGDHYLDEDDETDECCYICGDPDCQGECTTP